jgi:hypothetical protein
MRLQRGDLVRPKSLKARYYVREMSSRGAIIIPVRADRGYQHLRRLNELVKILTLTPRST